MLLLWDKYYIYLTSFVLLCNGQSDHKSGKKAAVEEIINKVFNLTSQSLTNASPDERKEIMDGIELKLTKSAKPLGARADKYVKLIMQGLQIMAKNQTQKQGKLLTEVLRSQSGLRSTNNSKVSLDQGQKDETIKKVANKILKLTEKYFQKAEKEGDDKNKIMESIKQNVLETAKQKHVQIHVKHNEIKKYSDLITRGMELMMKKMIEKPTAANRRMIMEFVNSKRKVKTRGQDDSYKQNDDIFYKTPLETINYEEDGVTRAPLNNHEILTTSLSCDEVFQQTCADIKSLNHFVCKNNKILPLNKLCDGVTDCADGSDEENCISQAMERLQSATSLMSRIEIYLVRNCFLSDNNALLIKQNTVLYEVLQRQIGFIEKYKNMNRDTLQLRDAFAFKRTLNEVAVVINTLAVALDSSLCIQYTNKKKAEIEARKFNPLDADDLDDLTEKPVHRVALKSCACSKSFCTNRTSIEACSRVCWYKYNLGRWTCQAIDEGTSVSLDVVCDGKLDCFDETDELDCKKGSTQGKFEANELFDTVLKAITTKSSSKEYSSVKNELVSLANSIVQLQKVATKPKTNVHEVKHARDKCYTYLTSIYENIVSKAYDVEELDDAHFFLLNVNERLMSALKQSHTGNDWIISPDGCYCRRGQCAVRSCTPSCKRACAISPKFTRYWCKGTIHNNISVPIEAICDDRPNCPLEDDEAQCSSDVCRKHHVILLNHKIRIVGDNQKGTAVGEALHSWKSKAMSSLKVLENNYRPTPLSFRDQVGEMLRDLVTVYASLDDTRRTNNDYVLKLFNDISQQIIESLKSCGK